MTLRKHFATLDGALRTARHEANHRGEATRVWRRTQKYRPYRFDVLWLNETPKGEGWEMVSEVAPDRKPDDER